MKKTSRMKTTSISLDAVIEILDETQQAIRTSRELERKSRELAQTAEELRQANDKLTRLDHMKDDFLSRVSHELRTPMTSIRSFSEILADRPDLDAEESHRFLAIIRHESERLTRLLDEILDLSSMESGQEAWAMVPVDAGQVVREALDSMRGLAAAHGVTLDSSLPRGDTPVLADADRLKQVIVNLVSNAIKYNDAQAPHVWIELRDDGRETVTIAVRDNGRGIPPEAREALFSKFSRGWNDLSRARGGSGLGLAISRQIMQQLGGSLEFDAEAGETTFVVQLRRMAGEAAAQ